MRRSAPTDGLYIVGVTGGIATGKSTLVAILARGGPSVVVDADALGHAVLLRPDVAQALAAEFGEEILDASGSVQRKVLGPRAFASDERLAALNRIVHPPLFDLVHETIDGCARGGWTGMVVFDAALLVEWDAGAWCDRVVAVLADPEFQAARLAARSGIAQDEARRRIARQLPNASRAAYADDVVPNDGTPLEFAQAAEALSARLWDEARAVLAARGKSL